MLGAARIHHDPQIAPTVCGPSNIGNYLAPHHIAATCGFRVTYEHLHAPNERIKLDTIQNDPPGVRVGHPLALGPYSDATPRLNQARRHDSAPS